MNESFRECQVSLIRLNQLCRVIFTEISRNVYKDSTENMLIIMLDRTHRQLQPDMKCVSRLAERNTCRGNVIGMSRCRCRQGQAVWRVFLTLVNTNGTVVTLRTSVKCFFNCVNVSTLFPRVKIAQSKQHCLKYNGWVWHLAMGTPSILTLSVFIKPTKRCHWCAGQSLLTTRQRATVWQCFFVLRPFCIHQFASFICSSLCFTSLGVCWGATILLAMFLFSAVFASINL